MGRPRDKFAWDQVEGSSKVWKCKYCWKEYSGASSRIRDHLSGQGNGIAPCEKASEAIKNEALKKVRPVKRGRGNSLAVSTSMNTALKKEEFEIDAFVKFLMCSNNVPSIHSDYVVKDPSFRELMGSVGQHGVLSLLRGDSLARQQSVLRIKHEVDLNMLMLTESWKTTGCTLMVFDLNNHNGKRKNHSEKPRIVIAIYCPKGIIFVEAPPVQEEETVPGNFDGYYAETLKRHLPSLYTDERDHSLFHFDDDVRCELNYFRNWRPFDSYNCVREKNMCLRSEIEKLYSLSKIDSEWAQSLVDVAVKIHEHLWSLGDDWYYPILKETDFSLESLFNKKASRVPIFLLIIQHGPERVSSPGHRMKQPDIEAITEGSKFWNDGHQLALILNSVLKFGDVMDTLVPTSGYFDMAFDKVKDTIECCRLQLGEDALQFWEQVKSKIEDIANTKIFLEFGCSRIAVSYLNPVYFLLRDPSSAAGELKKALEDFAMTRKADLKEFDKEVESYAQVFRNLSERIKLEDHHPVQLWEDYGRDLPVLRRCALELLSRPLSCVCKQVKEHLYQLEGADDYILRLNFRTMRHFQQLGDDIYKPLDLSQLDPKFAHYLETPLYFPLPQNLMSHENQYILFTDVYDVGSFAARIEEEMALRTSAAENAESVHPMSDCLLSYLSG